MSEENSFSTKRAEWFFSIDGQPYVLREALEDAVIAYKDVSARALQFSEAPGGVKAGTFGGGSEADAVLVSRCLFKMEGEGKESIVSIQFVRSLKHSISSRLYKWVKKNSGMEEEEETVEILERRIKDDTVKLERLRKGETVGKGSSSSTVSI